MTTVKLRHCTCGGTGVIALSEGGLKIVRCTRCKACVYPSREKVRDKWIEKESAEAQWNRESAYVDKLERALKRIFDFSGQTNDILRAVISEERTGLGEDFFR